MRKLFLILMMCCYAINFHAQQLKELSSDKTHPFTINGLKTLIDSITVNLPFFSLELDKKFVQANESTIE